ncbi:alpha/beta fold hydrolase [Cytophagaceae bacterium YF14B1]|uniref:Alpha/beta fold hydrolase n=1 Tax=Xanthocytophaga flava TaxID=3048013 RepID=A0AAE3QRA4_9BACT|nr:alpha/beta fold hydrolase [Xanthocytophaga flavus]MDJ1481404.1 alpha/beta fold hydrolase [Xanthocytophaga flavus]
MPVLPIPYYTPPIHQWNRHLQTILPNVFRRVEGIHYSRERIKTPDHDFLDLDWSQAQIPTTKLAILTHGLLGNSTRTYMLGMAKAFNRIGWDVLSWNMRGLSGEPNLLERMTTHGSSDELAIVIRHVLTYKEYKEISLVGFSKGGNIALKYAGELENTIPSEIKSIVAISSPCDVLGSVEAMGNHSLYGRMFRDKLKNFLVSKSSLIDPQALKKALTYSTLMDITKHYVAPLHGFKDDTEYCIRCSSLPYLSQIRVPALVLNAQNDPVLSASCSPADIAAQSDYLFLETPALGGHVGFSRFNEEMTWAEHRTIDFALHFK